MPAIDGHAVLNPRHRCYKPQPPIQNLGYLGIWVIDKPASTCGRPDLAGGRCRWYFDKESGTHDDTR